MDKILAPIKKRILQFIDIQKIKKEIFFKKIQVSSSNFRSKSLKSEVGGEVIAKILSIYPEINPTWLLNGTGEMIKSNQNSLNQNIIGNENYMAGKDIAIDKENKALTEEIKALKAQIMEKDLIIKTLVEQQKKLINKL